ncbi:MAG: lipid-A-disaccharide synthase [Spirulina sp. DLM2.Bin59]|nr:MAG: lipid-A-disaccharide synthase [Spirulina sp. DLM2.Bin59]
MRIFFSTGEVSGDLQGALLVGAIARQASQRGIKLEMAGLGGDRMAAAGMTLITNTTAIAGFGILESLPVVLPAMKARRKAEQYLQDHPPDMLILIDYEGFNSGLGAYCKRHFPQTQVVYYIAPQLWVWNPFPKKAQTLVALCDRIFAIFPEEARYFGDLGGNVTWVGHPLLDRMATAPSRATAREQLGIPPAETAIALVPASRPQEIKTLWPIIATAAQAIQQAQPGVKFWIPLSVPEFRPALEAAIAQYGLNAAIVEGNSLDILAAADLAIAKSGTVSLELALLQIPQVVIYRMTWLTMWVARTLFRLNIPYVSPANLLLMENIVPELIQENATPAKIVAESLALLHQPQRREQMRQDYGRMRSQMGELGVCDRAATGILDLMPQT